MVARRRPAPGARARGPADVDGSASPLTRLGGWLRDGGLGGGQAVRGAPRPEVADERRGGCRCLASASQIACSRSPWLWRWPSDRTSQPGTLTGRRFTSGFGRVSIRVSTAVVRSRAPSQSCRSDRHRPGRHAAAKPASSGWESELALTATAKATRTNNAQPRTVRVQAAPWMDCHARTSGRHQPPTASARRARLTTQTRHHIGNEHQSWPRGGRCPPRRHPG